jgi:hypothetical protein
VALELRGVPISAIKTPWFALNIRIDEKEEGHDVETYGMTFDKRVS